MPGKCLLFFKRSCPNYFDDLHEITFESDTVTDTLDLNVLENMVYGNSSFLQSFIQPPQDDLYFDYTLSITNSPHYGNITPLAIVSVLDSSHLRYNKAFAAPTGHHTSEHKLALLEMEIRAYGLASNGAGE